LKFSPDQIAMHTSAGVRKNNQDFCGFLVAPDGSAALMVLADGMGGHRCGEVASQLATDTLLTHFEQQGFAADAAGQLREGILEAHERIAREAEADPGKQGMGTTVVATVLRPGELTVAHVGDSRALQFRAPNVRRLTRDHLYVVDVLGLEENVAKTHPQGHILAQALGVGGDLEPTISQFDLAPGDRILLCCDGVSEYLNEAELGRLLLQLPLRDAVVRIVEAALANQSRDNCTALAAAIPQALGVRR
jgi:PPM family protein phosphatase